MSQSDYNIENADGATVRADINSQLEAIGSTNSGSTAPSVTFPYMRWHDTANSQLKERNGANTAWIVVADIVSGELVPHAGGAQVPQISGGADANFTAMPQVGGDALSVKPIAAGDTLTEHRGSDVSIAGGAFSTVFDISGPVDLVLGTVTGQNIARLRVTIDGTPLIIGADTQTIGRDGAGDSVGAMVVPPIHAASSLKLEVFNTSGLSQDFGWRVFTR